MSRHSKKGVVMAGGRADGDGAHEGGTRALSVSGQTDHTNSSNKMRCQGEGMLLRSSSVPSNPNFSAL